MRLLGIVFFPGLIHFCLSCCSNIIKFLFLFLFFRVSVDNSTCSDCTLIKVFKSK